MAILTVDSLSKHYGNLRALDAVSFSVPQGSVFGILGPNGSGKTTLLGILMNVLNSNSGTFTWDLGGPYTNATRKHIGTLLETPNFYPYLSAERNLTIAAKIKGKGEDDIYRVLKLVNLFQRKDSAFSTFSLGMKQRLAIASTLLGDPAVLVFDEPTNGLDPAGIAEIRELIIELSNNGKTIIMASHILDEVEKVCTHVAIIQKGVLKKTGSVKEILAGSTNATATIIVELSAPNLDELKAVMESFPGVTSIRQLRNELMLTCSVEINGTAINQHCFQHGITLEKLSVKKTSLEDKFLEITGTKSDN